MPTVHRRTFAVRGRPARRKTVWATTEATASGNIAGGNTQVTDLLAGILQQEGATVMRTHLKIKFTTQSIADVFRVGLIVGRPSDIPGGAASPVDVRTGGLQWALNDAVFVTSSGATFDSSVVRSWDIRAMRKVPELSSRYLLCITNPAGTNRDWVVFARVLVAMP